MTEMYVPPLINSLTCGADDFQDEVLAKAIEKADADVEKMKQEADEKRWRMVADRMKTMKVSIVFAQTHGIS
jgi:hypothetical protein